MKNNSTLWLNGEQKQHRIELVGKQCLELDFRNEFVIFGLLYGKKKVHKHWGDRVLQ